MGLEIGVVTTKGQIVIPARIRRLLGIKKGTKICFVDKGGEITLRPVTDEYIEKNAGVLDTGGRLAKALRGERRD